jgi:hypothetical protein
MIGATGLVATAAKEAKQVPQGGGREEYRKPVIY